MKPGDAHDEEPFAAEEAAESQASAANGDDVVPHDAEGDEPQVDDADGEETPRAPTYEADGCASTLGDWLAGAPLSRGAHLLLGLALPLIVGFAAMWRLRSFTIDDAFISYRYARNLADGLGLVYNAGERIEGYTNFSWTVLLALGAKLGVDPALGAKILGFACGLGSIGLAFHLESRVRPLRTVPALSPWLLASAVSFMGYAIFGLETAFFVLLVLGGLARMMREEELGGFPWSGVVFGLAGLTRPEAPMYLGLAMLFLKGRALVGLAAPAARPAVMFGGMAALAVALVLRLQPTPATTTTTIGVALLALGGAASVAGALPRALFSKQNLLRGVLFVAIVAAHLVWRKSYYGAWVPNTFTAKTGDMRQQIVGGLDYLKRYATSEGPLSVFATLGVGAAIAGRRRWLLAFATIGSCVLAYVAMVGGDWMPLYRFATPLQPFLYLVAAVGVRELVEERRPALTWGLALLGITLVAYRSARFDEERRKVLVDEKGFWDRAAGGVSRWYKELERRHGREAVAGEIALGDIGQVGYETGMPIVDLLGLVDPVVAKLPGGYTHKVGPGFRDYFFERKPRYFVLISAQGDCSHPSVTGSIAIFRDPRFRPAYAVSGRVLLTGGFSWCVYEKNETLDLDRPVIVVNEDSVFEQSRTSFGAIALPLSAPSSELPLRETRTTP